MVLEKTFECSLDSKETKPVNSKGNQRWIFIGKTDAEAEAPILWLPDVKSWFIGQDPDTRRDWEQEEKGTKRMRWLDDNIDSMDISLSKFQKIVKDVEAWHAAVHRVARSWYDRVTEQQQQMSSCSSDSVSLERVDSGPTRVSILQSLSCRKLTDSERRPGSPLSSWSSISFPNVTHTTSSSSVRFLQSVDLEEESGKIWLV